MCGISQDKIFPFTSDVLQVVNLYTSNLTSGKDS